MENRIFNIANKKLEVKDYNKDIYNSAWCILEVIYNELCSQNIPKEKVVEYMDNILSSDYNIKNTSVDYDLYFKIANNYIKCVSNYSLNNEVSKPLEKITDNNDDMHFNVMTLDNGSSYYLINSIFVNDNCYYYLINSNNINEVLFCKRNNNGTLSEIVDTVMLKEIIEKMYENKMLFID